MSSPSVAEFRAGVRAWPDAHDLSGSGSSDLDGQVAQLPRVQAALHDAGWMRYGWLDFLFSPRRGS